MEELWNLRSLAQFAPGLIMLALVWRLRVTVARFREAGVTAADRAVPLSQLGLRRDPVLRLLGRRGVVVLAAEGRYYLDLAAHQRWRKRRRVVVALALGAIVLMLMLVFWLHR